MDTLYDGGFDEVRCGGLVSLHAHLYVDGYSGMAAVEQVLVPKLDTERAVFERAGRFTKVACAFQEGASFAEDN